MRNKILDEIEQAHLKKDVPEFFVGDTVDVAIRIVEGDKQRTQVFSGTVIMRKGCGINETFTVRRIVNNEGVERVFPLHSPAIESIKSKRSGEVRRAKLYYLRDRVGKAVRLIEKRKVVAKDQAESGSAKSAPALAGSAR
ncbi:MAG: 50S ribosomal protein L19 [Phycisphaerales bacterium]|nr:50S ribosomal protein L19 [Phycisphaerales bacterium]